MIQPSSREHRLRAGAIEIVFRWIGDRWAHRVVERGDSEETVLESVEGATDGERSADWPASPPLVELALVPGTEAVVGIGRAGRSHFSVCFRPNETASPAEELLVEAACRIHEPSAWLGSTYVNTDGVLIRLAAAVDRAAAAAPPPRTVTWSYRIGRAGILSPGPTNHGPASR